MDIRDILKKTYLELKKAGSPTAEIDASILLEFSLNKSREFLLAHSEEFISNADYLRFRRLICRRKGGEPIAYIVKQKEFFSYNYYINKNVLVPRPESEMLIEIAINFLKLKNKNLKSDKNLSASHHQYPTILDVGTGSGCLIISLALEMKKKLKNYVLMPNFYASDISKKALYVARKNAKKHKVEKIIKFFHSNLFSNKKMPKKYDLIIANLPYVPKNDLKQHKKNNKLWKNPLLYEPENAIFAKNKGMNIIKKFIDQAKNRINNNGMILIEADPRNIKDISIYAKNCFKNFKIEIIKDFSNKKRVLKILT